MCFLHQSVGDTTICYLPPNLYDDETWLGLELFVVFKQRQAPAPCDVPSVLVIDLYAHGISTLTLPLLTYCHSPIALLGTYLALYHVPRKIFPKKLNRCRGISALFRSTSPGNLEVEMCGTSLLYEQNSELLVSSLIECTLWRPDVLSDLGIQAENQLEIVLNESSNQVETHAVDQQDQFSHGICFSIERLDCC